MKAYKLTSLCLAITFAFVGLIFFFIPDGVLSFFNMLSGHLGVPQSPVQGLDFYLILAVGYMYLVTLLAYFMYRHPRDGKYPLLLANGKLASAVLSFYLFLTHQPYLIYAANGVIDGGIGILVLLMYSRMKRCK